MNILSCYVIGAGYMGVTHLECHLRNPEVNVLGIIETDEAKGLALAEKHSLRWFPDIASAFAWTPAVFCDVCLPSAMHKSAVIQSMSLGAHVVCEKPFAVTLDDIDAMLDASRMYGKRLMVAHVCRFMPQYAQAKALLDGGRLGAPISLVCSRESETPAWSWNNWLYDKKISGGTLLDLSVHDLDIANWFLGEPEYHRASLVGTSGKPGVSFVMSTLGYPGGAQANVIANHLLPDGHPFVSAFRLTCSKGVVEFNTEVSPKVLTVFWDDGREDIPLDSLDGFENAYETELKSFVRCLRKGDEFVITNAQARLAVKTVHELYANMHETHAG
ncbi:MAG: Gfo/Idh/MocA family oxidoreductase [Sphaerochaetaceae bacterium]|nr:Gfo/Idh/MocA family oxidoreductase [Sphaerochaetaceae bacterium]